MDTEKPSAQLLFSNLDTDGLRRQQTAFCILTLFVLAMLLLLHTLFAVVLGEPSLPVLGVLGLSFVLRMLELVWLQNRRDPMTPRVARLDGAVSILSLFLLAGLLAWLTNRDHSPYQVLLAIPVLQSAFLFGLPTTVVTILGANATIFLWLWRYFAQHPQPHTAEYAEYLEGGMLAVVFALMGLLVWFLVSQWRINQKQLAATLTDLHAARERLVDEEKLAAIGRLASGIAHEIRNPVAMIMSALSIAADPSMQASEREEMFAIASHQADRLSSLTTDFLTYARPTVPRRSPVLVGDLLSGVEGFARVRAAGRPIRISCRTAQEVTVAIDASQAEGALLNLTLNAIDAVAESGAISISSAIAAGLLRIDVENSGPAISEPQMERIFEPFFTTKPAGTGLGLAIARGVARAHGGDLWVSRNENGCVVFTMTLGIDAAGGGEQEAADG